MDRGGFFQTSPEQFHLGPGRLACSRNIQWPTKQLHCYEKAKLQESPTSYRPLPLVRRYIISSTASSSAKTSFSNIKNVMSKPDPFCLYTCNKFVDHPGGTRSQGLVKGWEGGMTKDNDRSPIWARDIAMVGMESSLNMEITGRRLRKDNR